MKKILLFPVALYFIISEWLWNTLTPIIEYVKNHSILKAFELYYSSFVEKTNRFIVLISFIIPTLIAWPIKIYGLIMLAKGYVIFALFVLVITKITFFFLSNFMFTIAKEKLFTVPFVKTTYDFIINCISWAKSIVRPVIDKLREMVKG